MIKIFYEDKKSFADKYGEDLANLFFQNKDRLPKELSDISVWEREFKKNPKIARRRLKSYLDEYASSNELTKFKEKFGSALYTRFNNIKRLLPAQQKSYKYWLGSTREELWDVIDEYLPNSYWEQVQQGAELIKETPEWEIYRITNYEASEYYGRGTGWCTAGNYPGNENNGRSFFEKYAKEYYFYFSKTNSSLYNRFRKKPNVPGPEIQVWEGITSDGKTVDKENYNIQLPRIKAIDGEEQKSQSLPKLIDVISLTKWKAGRSSKPYVKSVLKCVNRDWHDRARFYIAIENSDGIHEAFPAVESDIWTDLCEYELENSDRFAEEFFTDEEIVQFNSQLSQPISGSDGDIIQAFRDDCGYKIVENGVNIQELKSIMGSLLSDQNFITANVDRIVAWEDDAFEDELAVKVFVDNHFIPINQCDMSGIPFHDFRFVGEYPQT